MRHIWVITAAMSLPLISSQGWAGPDRPDLVIRQSDVEVIESTQRKLRRALDEHREASDAGWSRGEVLATRSEPEGAAAWARLLMRTESADGVVQLRVVHLMRQTSRFRERAVPGMDHTRARLMERVAAHSRGFAVETLRPEDPQYDQQVDRLAAGPSLAVARIESIRALVEQLRTIGLDLEPEGTDASPGTTGPLTQLNLWGLDGLDGKGLLSGLDALNTGFDLDGLNERIGRIIGDLGPALRDLLDKFSGFGPSSSPGTSGLDPLVLNRRGIALGGAAGHPEFGGPWENQPGDPPSSDIAPLADRKQAARVIGWVVPGFVKEGMDLANDAIDAHQGAEQADKQSEMEARLKALEDRLNKLDPQGGPDSQNPDGGQTDPDSPSTPDGGVPRPDAGAPTPGPVPQDGGSETPHSGGAPSDGGVQPQDGGVPIVPQDGGTPGGDTPSDGGTPRDGGTPPAGGAPQGDPGSDPDPSGDPGDEPEADPDDTSPEDPTVGDPAGTQDPLGEGIGEGPAETEATRLAIGHFLDVGVDGEHTDPSPADRTPDPDGGEDVNGRMARPEGDSGAAVTTLTDWYRATARFLAAINPIR